MLSTVIPKERHPHWNQQLLYHSPKDCTEKNGFFWVSIFDYETDAAPFEVFYIPMTFFTANYTPVHLEVQCKPNDFGAHPSLFLSLTLEEDLQSFVGNPCTVALNWAEFDPLPLKTRNWCLMMTTDAKAPESDPFIKVDLREE